MTWEVEYTDEFETWFDGLSAEEQESIARVVGLLETRGAHLDYPYSSQIKASRHDHMRELRVQHHGRPYRVLYAFDPRRVGLLLIGGDKTGNDGWYADYVPIADDLYDEHLRTLQP